MPSTTNPRISNGEAVRGPTGRRLFAVSDLHVAHEQNRAAVKDLHPSDPSDWLIVAGDIGALTADVEWALRLLAERFAQVVWVPGNHDWHRRYRAATVVYGHPHVPRTTWRDGVPHREVSLGCPRAWQARGRPDPLLREILSRRGALSQRGAR
ncbi:metallophosphoesterase family protein [Streptomyces sp. AN091965]|uniref:metallophosphoesterase family protein n=1 Tax=Streptomyces sp. AN091965 TaxID=2927803 RepID=UPI001F61F297|nr:metallophosphoesterase family protein [Streptomyces sp. AN091965]MCI3934724.1 metallophosphoesterase [Streptomyces sp. AN091965]